MFKGQNDNGLVLIIGKGFGSERVQNYELPMIGPILKTWVCLILIY